MIKWFHLHLYGRCEIQWHLKCCLKFPMGGKNLSFFHAGQDWHVRDICSRLFPGGVRDLQADRGGQLNVLLRQHVPPVWQQHYGPVQGRRVLTLIKKKIGHNRSLPHSQTDSRRFGLEVSAPAIDRAWIQNVSWGERTKTDKRHTTARWSFLAKISRCDCCWLLKSLLVHSDGV